MRFFKLVTILLFIFYSSLYSQGFDREKTDSLINARGEAYIAIPNLSLKADRVVPDKLIFDRYSESMSYFYVNRASFNQLEESGLDYFYVIPPSLLEPVTMAQSVQDVLDGTGYPTYQQYLELMDSFRTKYPTICRLDTIGHSINGRYILSARVHSGDFTDGERPVMMYSSTMHGDEPVGFVLLIMLLNEILKGYGTIQSITELIDNTVILVNPLSNPDGTYFNGDTTIFGAIRGNANYSDLNRDFPDCRENLNYTIYGRQTETMDMMYYLEKYKPSISANFHSGSEIINYPWDRKWRNARNQQLTKYHPDMNWFVSLSKEYVDTARLINPNYMTAESEQGFLMGALWYEITGGRQDYVTYFLRGREVTIELSSEKLPPVSELPEFWNLNRASLVNFLRQGLYGLHGEVRDSLTNDPIKAKVFISGHDSLNSFVYSDHNTGRFFRYLSSGSYDLWAIADGYIPEIIKSVNINNYIRTPLDIRLKSLKNLLKDMEILIFPNPFNYKFTVLFYTVAQEDIRILIYNLDGKLVYSDTYISETGVNEKTIDLSEQQSGFYIFKLITPGTVITQKIIKTE